MFSLIGHHFRSSYCYIILWVLRIPSAEGNFKAFSHLISQFKAAAIFQGTILFMYFQPTSSHSLDGLKWNHCSIFLWSPWWTLWFADSETNAKQPWKKWKIKCSLHNLLLCACTHLCSGNLIYFIFIHLFYFLHDMQLKFLHIFQFGEIINVSFNYKKILLVFKLNCV